MEEKRAIITESMNKLDKEFLDKITNTITEGLAAAKYRYYRTFQCDVHEQFHTLSQGKGTYRYVNQRIYPENQNAAG